MAILLKGSDSINRFLHVKFMKNGELYLCNCKICIDY